MGEEEKKDRLTTEIRMSKRIGMLMTMILALALSAAEGWERTRRG